MLSATLPSDLTPVIRDVVHAALRVASPRARRLRAPAQSVAEVLNVYLSADRYTGSHAIRVANVSLALAARFQPGDTRFLIQVYTGALLHDIGKITLPDGLLDKPGDLTPEERSLMQRHPEEGERLLREVLSEETILATVRSHHECMDGRGYPDRLCGEQIPLSARIVAVADAFDAMLSERPYRAGRPIGAVLTTFCEDQGRQWDPCIARILYALSEDGHLRPEEAAAVSQPLTSQTFSLDELPKTLFR